MKILTLLGFLVLLTTSPMPNCIPGQVDAVPHYAGFSSVLPIVIFSSILLNAKQKCPSGYTLYSTECGRFCYRYEAETCRSWDDSHTDCRADGADLLEPDNCTYPFFHGIVKQGTGPCKNAWIGGFRTLPRSEYVSVRGNPIPDNFQYWSFSNPSRIADQACLLIDSLRGYMMNDQYCRRLGGYICQKSESLTVS